jgi:hypothetical protein
LEDSPPLQNVSNAKILIGVEMMCVLCGNLFENVSKKDMANGTAEWNISGFLWSAKSGIGFLSI